MFEKDADQEKVMKILDEIVQAELGGVLRYTHYSFMVYGYGRIPIVSWLRAQATEGLTHAQEAGELLTQLGGHPTLAVEGLRDTHKHDIGDILRGSLEHERAAIELYRRLLAEVEGKSVIFEEYARRMIEEEVRHVGEVDKMLRKPGEAAPFIA
jgi:bacterioferritin